MSQPIRIDRVYKHVTLLSGQKIDGYFRLDSSTTGYNASVPVLAARNEAGVIVIPLSSVAHMAAPNEEED